WSVVAGAGGSFVNASDPNTTFNGAAGVTYTLRWTANSPLGICASTSDDIIVRFEGTPTVANAGPDQNLCGATSALLAGNTPTAGTGLWTIISGSGGSFDDATVPNTTFNGTAGTAYVLRWTLNNGLCADSFDEVSIKFDQTP